MSLTGLKVGGMIRDQMREKLRLKATQPIFCPNCAMPMRIVSYVIARPDEAICDACQASWEDVKDYAPCCVNCGYSADHREGLGCVLEPAE